jgi:hypothetical protein
MSLFLDVQYISGTGHKPLLIWPVYSEKRINDLLYPRIVGQNYTNKSVILKDGKKNIYQRIETCYHQAGFRTRALGSS